MVTMCSVLKIGERFYPFCADRQSLTFSEVQMFFREEQKVREGPLPVGGQGEGLLTHHFSIAGHAC